MSFLKTILVHRAKKAYSVEKLFEAFDNTIGCEKIAIERFVFFKDYFRIISYRNIHITVVHYWLALWMPLSCNVTMTIHDMGWLRNYKGLSYIYYYIFWFLLPMLRCSKVVVISGHTKAEVLNLLSRRLRNLIAPKLLIIYNHCPTPRGKIQKKVGKSILQIGSKPNKNRQLFLDVLGGVDEYSLTLVGRGSESLPKNARLFDNPSDDILLDLYDESEFLFFGSHYEGFGLPVLEALSRNTIPIISNISVFSEIFGGYVYQIPITDLGRLQFHLDKIGKDILLKTLLLNRGRQLLERYSTESFINNYNGIWK